MVYIYHIPFPQSYSSYSSWSIRLWPAAVLNDIFSVQPQLVPAGWGWNWGHPCSCKEAMGGGEGEGIQGWCEVVSGGRTLHSVCLLELESLKLWGQGERGWLGKRPDLRHESRRRRWRSLEARFFLWGNTFVMGITWTDTDKVVVNYWLLANW